MPPNIHEAARNTKQDQKDSKDSTVEYYHLEVQTRDENKDYGQDARIPVQQHATQQSNSRQSKHHNQDCARPRTQLSKTTETGKRPMNEVMMVRAQKGHKHELNSDAVIEHARAKGGVERSINTASLPSKATVAI
ncbi:hypothetical protein EV424DRAFT_1557642 [Suillus variegatus]|nr:hypothetical protein EV424DRAFT_1557642 [Suillus variegatus]